MRQTTTVFAAASETTETRLSMITMTTNYASSTDCTVLTHIAQYSSIITQLTSFLRRLFRRMGLHLYVLSMIISFCPSK